MQRNTLSMPGGETIWQYKRSGKRMMRPVLDLCAQTSPVKTGQMSTERHAKKKTDGRPSG